MNTPLTTRRICATGDVRAARRVQCAWPHGAAALAWKVLCTRSSSAFSCSRTCSAPPSLMAPSTSMLMVSCCASASLTAASTWVGWEVSSCLRWDQGRNSARDMCWSWTYPVTRQSLDANAPSWMVSAACDRVLIVFSCGRGKRPREQVGE